MKKSVIAILVFVAMFCIFYGIRYIENPEQTMEASLEVYENKIDTQGYIIRSEQVYNAPATGMVYHYIQEGTRVGKNRVLSTIYTGDVSEQTLSELNNINQKIADMESSINSDTTYMSGGTNSEENIENIKNNIIKAKLGGNVSKIQNYKAQINSIVTGNAQTVESESIDALYAKKASLEASLRNNKNDIYSQMSGVFSKNVDGLEAVLTPKNVVTYISEDYKNIKETAQNERANLAAGEALCKVVNNHEWYVMMLLSSDVTKELKVNQKVSVRFDSLPGIEASGRVEYISSEASGAENNVIVIKFEEYKEGVFSIRYSEMELILESYEGFKIPISALRIQDDERGVLVKSGATRIFKPCNVIYTDTERETVIVSPVRGGNTMLVTGDKILVGEK